MTTEFNLTTNCGKLPFNLSEKIGSIGSAEYFHRKDIEPTKDYNGVLLEEDVKEFIRLLDQWKEIMRTWHIELPTIHLLCSEFDNFKNKLAGNKLIGEKDGTI